MNSVNEPIRKTASTTRLISSYYAMVWADMKKVRSQVRW